MVFGVGGSAFTIYFNVNKDKLTVGRIFIIGLAILDIFASLSLTPQCPLIGYYRHMRKHGDSTYLDMFFILLVFVMFTYLTILTAIAVDRAVAVCRPFTYKPSRKRTYIVIAVASTLSLMLSLQSRIADILMDTPGRIGKMLIAVVIILSIITILISYSLIVYKLRKQNIKIAVVGTKTQLTGGFMSTTETASSRTKETPAEP